MLILLSILLLAYSITFVSKKYRVPMIPFIMENFISTMIGHPHHHPCPMSPNAGPELHTGPEPHNGPKPPARPESHHRPKPPARPEPHPGPKPPAGPGPHSGLKPPPRPEPHSGPKPPDSPESHRGDKNPPHPEPKPHEIRHKKPEPGNRKILILSSIVLIEAVVTIVLIMLGMREAAVSAIFIMTMILILSRFGELNEVYPAAIGAVMVLMTGSVTNSNLLEIIHKIGGSSITIISTLIMAIILESFGFFHWAASKLVSFSKGSGYRLYFLILLICFLMTLLFNNDGSILITTPILILLLRNLNLKPHEQIPFLISGALIATSSSAPIGVSNIVNLISLNIVHMSLFQYTTMMFVPSIIGLVFMAVILFVLLKDRILRVLQAPSDDIEELFFSNHQPPAGKSSPFGTKHNRTRFMFKILAFIFGVRCMIFVASYFGIPIEIVTVAGSIILLYIRWIYLRMNFIDVIKKAPWHILIFALSMYIIIYGLYNIGLTNLLGSICRPLISENLFNASYTMGGLITLLSNIFNNHPALMIGTIMIENMSLDPVTLKLVYLSSIIGSDIGSLILPIGTLASLLWMFILTKNGVKISWREYVKVTVIVIPLTVIFSLLMLYSWVHMVLSR